MGGEGGIVSNVISRAASTHLHVAYLAEQKHDVILGKFTLLSLLKLTHDFNALCKSAMHVSNRIVHKCN